MSTDPLTTIVTAGPPEAPKPVRRAALARLAFGSVPSSVMPHSLGPRHLAFLPPEALELDLDDPQQRHFGDYELLSKLGQGGMGVVYRARQRSLEREVAVKLLSAGPWASKDFIERFRREAQSAARMQHPNIVAIYEIGAHDELNFFSMRLVQGVSLAHELAESGPLAPKRAAQLMRTIAEALDYAHRLGVLHLDLKPANVLIDERGEPQVADFGLARRLDETLTRDNDEVSGTPSYMAPEQAQIHSHKLSQATDIYGLGAILYELLTGRPPFLGVTPHETLKRVIAEAPVGPRQLRAEIPADLEAICLKCLGKEPGERYGSARALAEDLGRFVDGRPVSVRPLNAAQRTLRWVRREPRFAGAVAAATLALLAGLVATTTQWRRADANADSARSSATAARTTAWAQRLDATWQNYDRGEWLDALPRLVANLREQEAAGAVAAAESERRRIGILLAASPRLIDVIALGREVVSVALSRDGKLIAAMTRLPGSGVPSIALHLIDADSGGVLWRTVIETTSLWPAFSADGATLRLDPWPYVFSDGHGVGAIAVRVDAKTGKVMPLPDALGTPRLAAYSRDGAVALLVDAKRAMRTWRTHDWQARGPVRRFEPESRVLLSDDGGTIAYTPGGQRMRLILLDADSGATRHTIDLRGAERMTGWRLSADGRLLAVATSLGRIALIDSRDGTERSLAQRCEANFNPPVFSPDGVWVAATCARTRSFVWQVDDGRLVAAPIAHAEPRTDLIEIDHVQRTLFAHEFGRPRIYRLAPSANAYAMPIAVTPVLNGEAERNEEASAFDPAHGLLAFGTPDGRLKIWRVPRGAVLPVSAPPLTPPDLAFDGEHLPAVQGTELRVVSAGNGEALGPPLTHAQPVHLAYLTPDGASAISASAREISVWDWRAGKLRFPPLRLPNTPLRVIPSPDGTRVLTSLGQYRADRFEEHLQMWRVADGTALGQATVAGPLEGARFSADGSRVIAWRGNSVWLRDGSTLAGPLTSVEHLDPAGNAVRVVEARMNSDEELHVTTRRHNIDYLAHYWRWDARTGDQRERLPLVGQAHRFVLSPSGGFASYGFDFTASRQFQRRQPEAALEWLPLPHRASFGPALAYSTDGRWLAEAPWNGTLLIDAATGKALSPPLLVPLDTNGPVADLAFDRSAQRLLARTTQARWLVWDVAPDRRTVAELEREQRLYAPQQGAGWIDAAAALDPAARAALRARDPGAGQLAAEPDAADPNLSFPPRPAGTSPLLLDLSAHYTPVHQLGLETAHLFDLRTVPAGQQRLLDIDFDIRGLIQLNGDSEDRPGSQHFAARVDGIALPAHASALDLLVGDYTGLPVLHPLLDAILHYRDGGERRVELKLRTGVPPTYQQTPSTLGEEEAWRGARVAWLGQVRQGDLRILGPRPLCVVRVHNPEPGRELATLSLVARSAAYIVAITAQTSLEPEATGR